MAYDRADERAAGSGPRLAVAVLTRNRPELAARCLDTLVGQASAAGVPVTVLVNGTEDHSVEYLQQRYPDIAVHASPTNLGCPGGRNRLTELVEAEWIAHVDDDGTVPDDFIATIIDELPHLTADTAVLAGNIVDPEDDSPPPPPPSGPSVLFEGGICVIRRSDFLRVGGYHTDGLRQGEETELALRLFDAGRTIWRSHRLLLFHPLPRGLAKRREALRTGLRQSLITGIKLCPWWLLPVWMVWKLVVHVPVAISIRAPGAYLGGVLDALRGLGSATRARRPVGYRAVLAASGRLNRG